jgi:ABC-type uncharacterized transport system ATPase subunit
VNNHELRWNCVYGPDSIDVQRINAAIAHQLLHVELLLCVGIDIEVLGAFESQSFNQPECHTRSGKIVVENLNVIIDLLDPKDMSVRFTIYTIVPSLYERRKTALSSIVDIDHVPSHLVSVTVRERFICHNLKCELLPGR